MASEIRERITSASLVSLILSMFCIGALIALIVYFLDEVQGKPEPAIMLLVAFLLATNIFSAAASAGKIYRVIKCYNGQ